MLSKCCFHLHRQTISETTDTIIAIAHFLSPLTKNNGTVSKWGLLSFHTTSPKHYH